MDRALTPTKLAPRAAAVARLCGANGKLIAAKNFVTRSHILANGPIRADFTLDYAPWQAGAGTTVHETKRITLDAGCAFEPHAINVSLRWRGYTDDCRGCRDAPGSGAAPARSRHRICVGHTSTCVRGVHIGTALLAASTVPPPKFALPCLQSQRSPGNAVFLFDIHSGDTVDYYAGSAWSQGRYSARRVILMQDLENTRERYAASDRHGQVGSGSH